MYQKYWLDQFIIIICVIHSHIYVCIYICNIHLAKVPGVWYYMLKFGDDILFLSNFTVYFLSSIIATLFLVGKHFINDEREQYIWYHISLLKHL